MPPTRKVRIATAKTTKDVFLVSGLQNPQSQSGRLTTSPSAQAA